mgnify:FL=1
MKENYESLKKELKTKKIAVLGAGVSNIPLLKQLACENCDVTLFDQKEKENINEDIQKLINKKKLKCFLGQNYLEGLKSFDIIFRSPSLLPSNPYLKEEESRGCYITTEVEEVIKYAPCKVIGITGSKGKTTTTTIVSKILENLGYNVYVGGNIGTPLFTKIEQLKETDIVVLELSSFQLMGMRTSPDIAVVTNISPDHLDIHGSYEEYINAKKYIFKNAKKNSILVLNSEDEIVKNFAREFEGEVRYFGTNSNLDTYYLKENKIWNKEKEIIDTTKLILKGKHNYINICAALSAIKDFIKDTSNLEAILKNIPSVPHRLEFVREIDGVKWYNDSASTTPDKCLGGLSAFSEKIVLIAGGSDKNIPYTPLAKPVTEKVSKLILFGQTKNKIYDAVMEEVKRTNNRSLKIYVLDDLESAISVAKKVAVSGEVVLFSPASASFDMFKNAYQRGDIFKKLVNDIEK